MSLLSATQPLNGAIVGVGDQAGEPEDTEIQALSADGSTIAGEGKNPGGADVDWIVSWLPAADSSLHLKITRTDDVVRISWPDSAAAAATLLETPLITGNEWTAVPGLPVHSEDEWFVTVSADQPLGFYQLRVSEEGAPVIVTQPADQEAELDQSLSLTVTVIGEGPFTYEWLHEGTNLPVSTIETVAGSGATGYAGDGGPALDAHLNHPVGICADRAGSLYLSDLDNHVVRKVSPDGLISTAAGTGTAGFSGDGGPARDAEFDFPVGLATDRSDALYISDRNNQRIRKIRFHDRPTLVMDRLSAISLGTYQVIVRGSGGSATSRVATVSIKTNRSSPAQAAIGKPRDSKTLP